MGHNRVAERPLEIPVLCPGFRYRMAIMRVEVGLKNPISSGGGPPRRNEQPWTPAGIVGISYHEYRTDAASAADVTVLAFRRIFLRIFLSQHSNEAVRRSHFYFFFRIFTIISMGRFEFHLFLRWHFLHFS